MERFGPVRVLEFYGSTEGNVVLANITGEKVGSVGRQLMGSGRLELVQYDPNLGGFIRDTDGSYLPVAAGEPGVLLGEITSGGVMTRFDGYTDLPSTDAKVLENVFEKGDRWFNTGDVLRCDDDGDFFFVDRIGDTYRWKGENVSTQEVALVIDDVEAILAAAVYGILLPGREGRVGMAAIELNEGAAFPAGELYAHVSDNLFPAARPRFIRVVERLQTTESLKFQKATLREEGADPGRIADPIYTMDRDQKTYVRLDLEGYHHLLDHDALLRG